MKRWVPIGLLLVIVLVSFGVYVPFLSRKDPAATSGGAPVEVWSCHALLIGKAQETCTGDIRGPGRLTITFRPDPPRGG
jgi:flagellar basal body-associated protein FliL